MKRLIIVAAIALSGCVSQKQLTQQKQRVDFLEYKTGLLQQLAAQQITNEEYNELIASWNALNTK